MSNGNGTMPRLEIVIGPGGIQMHSTMNSEQISYIIQFLCWTIQSQFKPASVAPITLPKLQLPPSAFRNEGQ